MNLKSDKIKIALVEDHEVVRTAIGRLLNEIEGFQVVIEVANGQEFLDNFLETKVDVVLIDLEMPILNGLQVIRALRGRGSNVGVIVLSTYSDVDMAFDILSEGADAYLLKECSTNEMVMAIQSVSSGKKYSNQFMNEVIMSSMKEDRRVHNIVRDNGLTERDLKVLRLVCDGFTSKDIGEKIFTSKKNVDLIRTQLMRKLKVSSANELIRESIVMGLYKPRSNAEIKLELEDSLLCKKLNRELKGINSMK